MSKLGQIITEVLARRDAERANLKRRTLFERGLAQCLNCGNRIQDKGKCCKTCGKRCGLKYGCGSSACRAGSPPPGFRRNDAGGFQKAED